MKNRFYIKGRALNLVLIQRPGETYPGYQRFFSRAAGIFGVGQRPTHKDLTETGNRARKVSGTQGRGNSEMAY